jgi:aromatic-L-amino-acid decarboxylase
LINFTAFSVICLLSYFSIDFILAFSKHRVGIPFVHKLFSHSLLHSNMDSKQFRKAAASAIDESRYTSLFYVLSADKLVINYYDTIGDRRVVSNVEPGYLKKLLPDGPPRDGEPWAEIQKDIESKILPGVTHWYDFWINIAILANSFSRQSPNFMAFFPANSSFPGMLGDLYSGAFTAPAFNWICSPAVTELETVVLDWLAKMLNLPSCYLSTGEGGGVIQGSASEAIVTVMVAARDKYLRETTAHLSGEDKEDAIAQKRGKLVALGSEMAHSSTQKAAQIAGVRYRSVPTGIEDGFAMTGPALQKTIEQCKAKGLEPFYLTTTLGTTATCAVDDFSAIASVLNAHCPPGPGEIWVHVDAAYAGAALILPEYQHHTSSFYHFHSFDMNMHKWLLTNFDASCLFIKKRKDLIDSLSITPSYLRNEFTESGLVTDYRDWQIPLGRRFRSLKIWFVMRTYGISGLQQYIRKHVKLGEIFYSLLRSRMDLFHIITGPSFALNVFNILPKNKAAERGETDEVTKAVYELINKRGEIYITSSVIGGVYAIRVVSGSPFVDEAHIRRAFEIIVSTAEEVLEEEAVMTNGVTEKDQFVEAGRGASK